MPRITDVLPQTEEKIEFITLADVIKKLPEHLLVNLNVWIGGRIARYGQTADALIFLVEQDGEPDTQLMMYFENIMHPYPATVSEAWKDERISALRLYNFGKLIIDKETLEYTELPATTVEIPVITLDDILDKFPKTIDCSANIYLTGSLVKHGYSHNDVDFMVDSQNPDIFRRLRDYFGNLLKCKVDVGNAEMPEREPVYKYKLYSNGVLQLKDNEKL